MSAASGSTGTGASAELVRRVDEDPMRELPLVGSGLRARAPMAPGILLARRETRS